MKKFSLKVSGSRVGDSVRPASDIVVGAEVAEAVVEVMPRAPRFGLRAPRAPFVAPVKVAAVITADDYATLEDYK